MSAIDRLLVELNAAKKAVELVRQMHGRYTFTHHEDGTADLAFRMMPGESEQWFKDATALLGDEAKRELASIFGG